VTSDDQIFDSPTGWVAEHINDYVATGGKRGHLWKGVPTLLLTTRGRKTGALRRTALIYGRDGDSYVVVASIGGAPKHPEWYLNLVADPEVRLQVGAEIMAGRARRPTETRRSGCGGRWPRSGPNTTNIRRRPTA
jgi:deazaflavin-dependent oxidoreductase (nitroreductase family)